MDMILDIGKPVGVCSTWHNRKAIGNTRARLRARLRLRLRLVRLFDRMPASSTCGLLGAKKPLCEDGLCGIGGMGLTGDCPFAQMMVPVKTSVLFRIAANGTSGRLVNKYDLA
jgi:hypothetical protein